MPQKFMDDPNVALKWKLYGYLNGFWLSGKPVYSRNDTIAKQFGKSERAVQFALEELETMGLITRDIKGLSRYILPGGIKEEGRSPASPTHEAQLHQGDEAQLHHISDSISDSKYTESLRSSELPIVEVEETPKERKESKSKTYEELCKWLESTTGVKIVNRAKQYAHLAKARTAEIAPSRLKARAEELLSEPWYQAHGLDWGNVVNSFDKRA